MDAGQAARGRELCGMQLEFGRIGQLELLVAAIESVTSWKGCGVLMEEEGEVEELGAGKSRQNMGFGQTR